MRETWPLQGGVDTQGDWDQTEAVALAPEAPTSSRSLERRRPPPTAPVAGQVCWLGPPTVYVCACVSMAGAGR